MMTDRQIPKVTLVAVIVATTAALIARAVIGIQLAKLGYDTTLARDLSYLVVPVVLAFLLFPIWSSEKGFIAEQFRLSDLSWRVALSAIAIGVLVRATWWSQLIAGASFGLYGPGDPSLIEGPRFSIQCPAPLVLALGFLVMAFLIPIIEELTHRAYVQTALRRRGAIVSIIVSAFAFAIFHTYTSMLFAFLGGLVFGVQYWVAKSLWPSVIAHAMYNGLSQIDWRCLSSQWNPRGDVFPIWLPGITASVLSVACLFGIFYLLRRMAIGAQGAPIASR
jgi:membrane protease YdiL (CAAX protease family)